MTCHFIIEPTQTNMHIQIQGRIKLSSLELEFDFIEFESNIQSLIGSY